MGQRYNSEFPRGVKPQTFGFCTLMLNHLATESMMSKACYEICMRHIRISDVDSIMLVSKIRQMVSFELSNEIEWERKGPRFNSAWGLVMLSFSHGL